MNFEWAEAVLGAEGIESIFKIWCEMTLEEDYNSLSACGKDFLYQQFKDTITDGFNSLWIKATK